MLVFTNRICVRPNTWGQFVADSVYANLLIFFRLLIDTGIVKKKKKRGTGNLVTVMFHASDVLIQLYNCLISFSHPYFSQITYH